MWKALFESSFIGKILFYGLVCLLIWFMQARLERMQKNLAQKEEQCIILQNANQKQQENIVQLVQEHQKQAELLVQAEQEKQKLVHVYKKKQRQFYISSDKESTNWKQTKIPEPVLQILKGEKE